MKYDIEQLKDLTGTMNQEIRPLVNEIAGDK